jgi:dihydrolipoamide dehydrogenase
MKEFDCVVIGGGPGGYAAAIRAAQEGLSVALVEKEALGGTCLNWGCIPTKSLLHGADLIRHMRHAADFGVSVKGFEVNLEAMVGQSREAAATLSNGISGLMRKHKITVFKEHAEILGAGQIRLSASGELLADAIVIATGAKARHLPHIECESDHLWTAREAMTPAFLPKRLLIVGAGAIGVEFASFYSALGSKVTLIEAADAVLPAEDHEISAFAKASLIEQGIEVHTQTPLESLSGKKQLQAVFNGQSKRFDACIMSVGVSANVEGLGLENVGLSLEQGFLAVDSEQRTRVPGIYAIGDVAGGPCLAHKATHEAIIVAEVIAGKQPHGLRRDRIPGCTYSAPQVASIGLREQDAGDRAIKVGRFPFYANGKAVASQAGEGLIKTIFDDATGALLGAHMIGEGVTELIQGFAIAINLETTEQELIDTVFPHPTLSEAMHESVLQAFGRPIHL